MMENTVVKNENEVFCGSCGSKIRKEAVICPNCGVRQMPLTTRISTKIPVGQVLRIGVLLLCLFLLIVGASIGTGMVFISPRNLVNIMRQFVRLMIMGVTAFVVMSSGGVDFSIGSLVGLTGVFVGTFNGSFLGIIIALFAGIVFGCINGVIAVKTPVKPYLVTIATMTLIRGIALAISGGTAKPVQVSSDYFPIQVLLAVLILGFSFLLLFKENGIFDSKKVNNSLSAKNDVYILYYLLSSFSAVIVGIFLSFRLRVAQPMVGSDYEVDALLIAILGGALCGYGAINIVSTIISALLVAVMVNFFILTTINSFTQNILKIVVLFIGFIPVIIKGFMIPKEEKAVTAGSTNTPKYCAHCGAESGVNDTICLKCGCKL
jgi:ribose transport system permease protein